MAHDELPPLTGSALFDPWRIRYRLLLAGELAPQPPRRPTRSEILLWEQLREETPDWFAEHPTRYGYTLDFYCPAVKLAVEVDGASHWGQVKAEKDALRDTTHELMGIQTKRFSAREVETDVRWVVSEIRGLVERRAASRAAGRDVPQPAEPRDVEDLAPPAPPLDAGWSAYLPACRTVLPTHVESNGLYGRLLRTR